MIGECFVEQSVDEAKGFIETRKVSYEKELKSLVDKIEQTKKRMNELKIILYAKFGKNINLEETEE
jgi:prefoldin subunit 4